jgi:hypothetical protein
MLAKTFSWLGSEVLLGAAIAILSVFTGLSSYQSQMASSDQNKYQNQGMKALSDANAAFLMANQYTLYDYSLYDNWATNESGPKASYYEGNFSNELKASIKANPDDPFSEAYYAEMKKAADEKSAESDAKLAIAENFNGRGDELQLVMLIAAIGLSFAAWASLLNAKSVMRLLFSFMSIVTGILALVAYLSVRVVVV